MVAKEAPHPNATKVFVNWLLSKEGSSLVAPAIGYPSARSDVPTDHFMPVLVPRPGDIRVEIEIDGWSLTKGKMQRAAAELFGSLLK